MPTATMHEVKERLVLQPASSTYQTLGNAYKHSGSIVKYSGSLRRTGKKYYDSKAEIPEGLRMSTAAEELAIQLALERADNDPRKAKAFDDLFAKDNDKIYMWQWTETGLRVPKGRKADAYETDAQGRRYHPRIVLIGDQEVGEILVPEGNGRVAVEWDEVFGLPRVTEDIAYPHEPHTTHFWFNSTPDKDSKSGNYDVAVGRGGGWPRVEGGWCLAVAASCGRWDASSVDGFRPVQGSFPEIERELARINPKDVENELLARMRRDRRSMSYPAFVEKYNL